MLSTIMLQPLTQLAPAFIYDIYRIYRIQDFVWPLLLALALTLASPSFVIAHR